MHSYAYMHTYTPYNKTVTSKILLILCTPIPPPPPKKNNNTCIPCSSHTWPTCSLAAALSCDNCKLSPFPLYTYSTFSSLSASALGTACRKVLAAAPVSILNPSPLIHWCTLPFPACWYLSPGQLEVSVPTPTSSFTPSPPPPPPSLSPATPHPHTYSSPPPPTHTHKQKPSPA